jgi:hypothetical protein
VNRFGPVGQFGIHGMVSLRFLRPWSSNHTPRGRFGERRSRWKRCSGRDTIASFLELVLDLYAMRTFHVIIERRAAEAGSLVPFSITFEDVCRRLSELPGCYCEPDGSFSIGTAAWRIDGALFDRDGALLYIELRGACPPDVMKAIIGVLGGPYADLVFQLPERGVWLNADEFLAQLDA